MGPQPREVWFVRDSEVKLHSENRTDKGNRPVLVVTSVDLAGSDIPMINVVPLTTSSEWDELTYPVSRAYYKTFDGFNPETNSSAIIPLYQPILKKHFADRCGILEADAYEAIRHTLCLKVVGYPDFDIP
jgi:mRNA-degrading endonuclease toxin of MazEF toxin-antitoxin module